MEEVPDSQPPASAHSIKDLQQSLQVPSLDHGLSKEEAAKRLKANGPNSIESHPTPKWLIFLRQFNNLIIYILIIAAILTTVIGDVTDTSVIVLVIIINAIIGYYQESNASDSLEKIKKMLAPEATVYRDGERLDIPSANLVVGDVVFLEAGDNVPADLRLVDIDNLTIQEAVLTGEANSVIKTTATLPADTPLADQSNIAFASTAVAGGSGIGIVVATGHQTEFGKISQAVSDVRKGRSPMMREIDGIGKGISYAIIAAAVLLFIFGLVIGEYSLPVLALAIVTMVVGSMPEGLPATTSVILAMGVSNMAKKQHVIVKTLPAAETLGSVDVICTDKTGTLTKNEMTITTIVTPQATYDVSGTGYAPTGDFSMAGRVIDPAEHADLSALLTAGFEANDTELHQEDGRYVINGEPTDGSFLTAYYKAFKQEPANTERDLMPFDSNNRYMAKLAKCVDGQTRLFVKGSPDKILPLVATAHPDFDQDRYLKLTSQFSVQGQRVIAVAEKVVPNATTEITSELLSEGLDFLGITAIIDPPRESVITAIKQMRRAGVKVKMITGDHPETAIAIAKKLGLADSPEAVTGAQLAGLSDEKRRQLILNADVFARTTPKDKLTIVSVLQEAGNVTAMVGDGVNDAPALKKADVGVAMGQSGTDVAKDAADMVLTDDRFARMETAIAQGRRIYQNIKKSILFLLPTSFAEGLVIVFTILTQQEMPLRASQLLWINMVSAITIQFAFIFEPAEAGTMDRPPRKKNAAMMHKHDVFQIAYVAMLIAGIGLWAFDWLTANHLTDRTTASTMMVNMIVLGKIFYLFNIRTNTLALSKNLFSNPMAFAIIGIMLALQCFLTYVPFMQDIFQTAPMSWREWGLAILAGSIILIVTEIDKIIRIRRQRMRGHGAFRSVTKTQG
ncbi:HAD-IC family P-type ATPase [Lacticaseibacillus paracasei]|uniref:HAD-IC family P-type ATPase n=1 Tax=Lacticaseibacillus paracasei TaxID=1597 RepID=UPI003CE7B665